MNGFFVVYKEDTGEILNTLFMPESDVAYNYSEEKGESYITGEGYYDRDYVSRGELKRRPENPTALDGVFLKNVPEKSLIQIDSDFYPCEDGGDVKLSFNMPGTYIVRVESFPYLDKEFEIDYQPQS